MRPPDEEAAAREHALSRAKVAIHHRHFADAQRFMDSAAQLHANRVDLQWLHDEFFIEKRKSESREIMARTFGPIVCGLIYLIESVNGPREWTIPVWIAMTFLIIPAMVGFIMGRQVSPEQPASKRFWAAFVSVAIGIFAYTAFSLIMLRSRIGQPDSTGTIFVVGLLVSSIYAVIGGSVGGIAARYAYVRDPFEKGVGR